MGLKNTYQARKRFTKVPVSKTGMWYQDGDVVVPSNQITMKGPNGESDYFNSPIMGTGMQSGQTQVMYPGREYSFPNDNSVYETKMQIGGETSTEQNPVRMNPIDIQAPQRSWFDRNIEAPLRKWGRSYAKRISDATGGSEWYKQPNSVASAFFSTGPGFALEAPQLSATYTATGKVQTPSEAMDIQNPYGAFAVDALLDPSSALTLGSRTVNRAGRFLLDGLDNQVSRQINKNPKLALSLQNRRPIQSIDNVTISPGLRPGDVRSFGDYITTNTIKAKGDISELGFFEGLNKGTQSLDNSLRRRIEDLSSTEGFNRLVNQEKEYLINSGTDASVAERVAKLNAKARIDELKNTTNINNEAVKYSKNNFLGGVDNKFVKNKNLYSNAYFDKNYNNNIEDKIKNITGKINLQKPVENYSKSKPGGIGMGYNYVNDKPTEMHEIAHALQRGRKLPIDNQLRQLTPKNKLEIRDQRAYDYFNQGSQGKEASAFANELRESMFQKGFIPDYYSPINEQQVQDAYKYFKKNPIGVYDPKDGQFSSNTRIFDFMQPNKANSKILTDVLNKLPAAAPIVGGVGLGASQLQEKKYGGWLDSYQYGGETSTFLNPDKIEPVYINYKRSPDETFVRGVGLALDKLGLPAFLKLKGDNKNSEFPIENRESVYKYKINPNEVYLGNSGTGNPEIDYKRKENAALLFEENPVVSDAYQTNRIWNYYKDYMSSPMYAEMLQGKNNRENIEINRAKNLQKIQSIPNYDNISGVGGYYKPDSNQISLNPTVNDRPFTLNEIIPHELSHSTDVVGNLIPTEDLKNIKNKLKPKSEINLSNTVDFWKKYGDNPKEGTINYFSKPTEVRARLNTIRYNLYNKGVDIFNKPIKKEDLNNLNIQNLNELKYIYKDDDILWLLNNISKTDNKTDSIKQMAKYGASMIDSQKSGLQMSYLKTKRFK